MPILLDLRNYKIFCTCTIQTFSCLDFEPQISLVAFTSCDINSTTVVLTYDRLATKQIIYDICFYKVINTLDVLYVCDVIIKINVRYVIINRFLRYIYTVNFAPLTGILPSHTATYDKHAKTGQSLPHIAIM